MSIYQSTHTQPQIDAAVDATTTLGQQIGVLETDMTGVKTTLQLKADQSQVSDMLVVQNQQTAAIVSLGADLNTKANASDTTAALNAKADKFEAPHPDNWKVLEISNARPGFILTGSPSEWGQVVQVFDEALQVWKPLAQLTTISPSVTRLAIRVKGSIDIPAAAAGITFNTVDPSQQEGVTFAARSGVQSFITVVNQGVKVTFPILTYATDKSSMVPGPDFDSQNAVFFDLPGTTMNLEDVYKAAVTYDALVNKSRIYIDNTSLVSREDGSIAAPFKSIISAVNYIQSMPVSLRKGMLLELGSSTVYNEDAVVDGVTDWTIRSWGSNVNPGAQVRGVTIQNSTEVYFEGVDCTANAVINLSGNQSGEAANARINGTVTVNLTAGANNFWRFSNMTVIGKFNVIGNGVGRVEFVGCDFSDSTFMENVTINAPNVTIVLSGCMDARVHRAQGKVNIRDNTYLEEVNNTGFCYISENTPGFTFFYDCSTEDYNGALRPIQLKGTADYALGISTFLGTGSQLQGNFISAGPGSMQVRDNGTRAGYQPIIRDVGGASPVGRTLANTMKDHLNGIGDALVRDRAIIPEDDFLLNVPVTLDASGNVVQGGQMIALVVRFINGRMKVYGKKRASYHIVDDNTSTTHTLDRVDGLVVGATLTQPDTSVSPVSFNDYTIVSITGTSVVFDKSFRPITYTTGNRTIYDFNQGLVFDLDIGSATAGIASIDIGPDPTPGASNALSVIFTLTNGNKAYLHVSDMAAYSAGNGIAISGTQQISVTVVSGSQLSVSSGALGFNTGYEAYPTADKNKLAALPTNANLTTMLYNKVDTVTGKGLSTNDYTNADMTKLSALPDNVTLQSTLNNKVDVVAGKGLSTNDYSNDDYVKLSALPTNAVLQSSLNLKAPLASPALTGTPTAPTAGAGTNTTQIATTAFVTTADNLKANLASPALTGTPTAPTAAVGTNTTQLATTAYVIAQIASAPVIQRMYWSTAGVLTVVMNKQPTSIAIYNAVANGTIAGTWGTAGATMTFTPTTASQILAGDFGVVVS